MLDPEVGEQLKAMAAPLGMPAMPGQIRSEWIVEVDDRLIAETYQAVYDVLWQRSEGDLFVRGDVLETNIAGWSVAGYEFNDEEKRHVLKMVPVVQVYIDPTVGDIQHASYAGYDMPMDADEAKAAYPALAAKIDETKRSGRLENPDGQSQFSEQFEHDYQRDMVVFRVFWLRNQRVQMTPEQALAAGLVSEVQQGDDPNGMPAPAEAGLGEAGNDGPGAGPGLPEVPPDPAGVLPPNEPARFLLADSGIPVAPGDPHWPTKLGIRQITLIDRNVVSDREAEFWDIPLLHNVCIPLPGQHPWGLGEPEAMRAIQKAMSRTLDSMVLHADYNAHPFGEMPSSVADAYGKEYKDGFVRPGRIAVVDDELARTSPNGVVKFYNPPAMSQALPDLFNILKGVSQEQTGHTPTLRGTAPSANASGKMVELLQSSGASLMGYKARRTGDMVRRCARLMLHSIVHRMSVEDIQRIVSKYPPHVLAVIHERARQMEWDVTVDVQAGTAGVKARKMQEAQLHLSAGAIDMQTYREMCGLDHRVIEQRLMAQAAKMMATAPQPGQPGQPGQEQPKQEGPPQ